MNYNYSIRSHSEKYQAYFVRANMSSNSVVGGLYYRTLGGLHTFIRDFRSAIRTDGRFGVKVSGGTTIYFRVANAVELPKP